MKTFLTWNINLDLGKKVADFPEYDVEHRLPYIQRTILDIRPNVLFLQEARKATTPGGIILTDSLTPMVNFLEDHGYICLQHKYNPSPVAFSYITAFDQSSYKVDKNKITVKYFSKTPDMPTEHPNMSNMTAEEKKVALAKVKDNNFGVEWEYSAFGSYALDETGKEIYFVNVHCGFSKEARFAASKIIAQMVKNALNENPMLSVVVAGDFNSFPDDGGEEQMLILRNAKSSYKINNEHFDESVQEYQNTRTFDYNILTEVTEQLYFKNDTKVPNNTTFRPYPYDLGSVSNIPEVKTRMNEIDNLDNINERRNATIDLFAQYVKASGNQLDHIFVNGFNTNEHAINCVTPINLEAYDTLWDEDNTKAYVLNHIGDGPAFPSDHDPIVFNLIPN